MKITDLLLTADKQYSEVLEVGGTLTLDPSKSITLSTNSNIIVTGKLISKPVFPAIHKIVFTGIDESKFHGGGESVLPADIGLWVMSNGQLDIQGEEKTAWLNASVAIIGSSKTISLESVPKNWHVGDELAISPTAEGQFSGETAIITAINGTIIGIDRVIKDRPVVNGIWTPEVMNLTRNARIEGTSSGKSHTFIMSMMMNSVMYCQFRYMGPRKDTNGDKIKEPVKGRYALHFHHCMEGSAGMCMEGNVARDCDNHTYVTHMSNGICWCDNIAYDVKEVPFWYDFGDSTHELEYDHNIVGNVGYVPGSVTLEDPDTNSFGAGAYLLGMGDGNSCHDNVAFGIDGQLGIDGTGGYQWRNNNESTWLFFGNKIHNCTTAPFDIWQNTAENHTVRDFVAYLCGAPRLGAYANVYHLLRCIFYKIALMVRAGSLTNLRLRIEESTFIKGGPGFGDAQGVTAAIIQMGSPVDTIGDGQPPVLYRGLKFIDCQTEIALIGGEKVHWADVVDCNIQKPVVKNTEQMRVQDKGQAYQLTTAGKKAIAVFAPSLWGQGNGVLIEYFSDTGFRTKVAQIIQPQLNFSEWQNLGGPHHEITSTKYSIRATGKIQPQFTDTYTFSLPSDAGGSGTIYIDGKAVKSVALKAGQLYDLRVDFISSGTKISGPSLVWNCPSMSSWSKTGEVVPESQLYTPGTTPPVNQPPKANAGPDQTITLPVNSTVLNGTGSDADGVIKSYLWSKQSGPVGFLIANPSNPSTQITGLTEGVYTFGLLVTDDKGATASDSVTITVKPAVTQPNQPPVVTASATANVIKTGTIFLNGGATDPEGGALTYLWQQVSGTSVTIQNPTSAVTTAPNAPAGNYIFTLTVTDNKGAKTSVNVSQTI